MREYLGQHAAIERQWLVNDAFRAGNFFFDKDTGLWRLTLVYSRALSEAHVEALTKHKARGNP